MQRLLGMFLLSLICSVAWAEQLADGIKAWEQGDYAQAHQIFGRLADAGNADAQLQLGEMYGFGEGVQEDRAKGEYWINKALANGNKDAPASLETLRQRAARKADIAYYVNSYDGADVKLDKFACVKPQIPATSTTPAEVKAISAGLTGWLDCYGRFTKNIGEMLPVGKAIPGDIARIMSTGEFQQARERMSQVYAAVAGEAKKQALELIAANDAWVKATEADALAREAQRSNEEEINRIITRQRNEAMEAASVRRAVGR